MSKIKREFDVVIVGGGHAGCEAFGAACRIGVRACLVLPSLAEAGFQPCNPAVGGPGKGHLVREVVALGGLMGKVTDESGLQFRTLNARKGPAVRATRVQTDSGIYSKRMEAALSEISGGVILEDRAIGILWNKRGGRRYIDGVRLMRGGDLGTRAVVIATGTFLRGQLFVGDKIRPGGRLGAAPAVRLAGSLADMGLPLIRLKTGTCPRLDGATIDVRGLDPQRTETPTPFFDPSSTETALPQLTCYLTYTGEKAHRVVRDNLEKSALYSGAISGVGPRYCPSFETKIARFPDKDSHQIFLEPEDQNSSVVYPSGLSTSLPERVQDELVRAIPGLENARIVRYGYAVEYDAVRPNVLSPELQVEGCDGLFLAGQILGTSGYEEAAALGLIAGANAALWARGDSPVVFGRDEAYAGVMIDDLTSKGVDEPYRMFTSRAEYRLLLREDNADERMLECAMGTGLIDRERSRAVQEKITAIKDALERLRGYRLTPSKETNAQLRDAGLSEISKPHSLLDLLRRNAVGLKDIRFLAPWIDQLPPVVRTRLEVDIKYSGYLDRQAAEAAKLRHVDQVRLPADIDYKSMPGLRPEIVEKIAATNPSTLGQVSRIPGVTPAAVSIIHVWCERMRTK